MSLVCTTCQEPFAAPACASPEHKRIEREIGLGWRNPDGSGRRGMYSSSKASRRAAAMAGQFNNVTELVVGSKVGKSECPECLRWLPNDHFWSRTRKVRTSKCGNCLRKRRLQRPAKLGKKARARRKTDEASAYWEAQAAAHQ